MNLRFVYIFAKIYGFNTIRRVAAYIVSSLLIPLSLLFIFSIVSSGSLIPFAILGGFISIIVSNALITMNDAANLRLQWKFQDLIVATKLTPMSYMFGLMLNNIFFATPGIILYIAIGIIFHLYTPLLFVIMAAILLLLYIAVSSIAFFASSLPSHTRAVWGYTTIITLILGLFPPIFYPYNLLPKPLLYAFLVLPSTSASILIQNIYGLTPAFPPALYIFIIETVICFFVAMKFIRWRAK